MRTICFETTRALSVVLCLALAPAAMGEASRPGMVDLAGRWQYHVEAPVGDASTGVASAGSDKADWAPLDLPTVGSSLGLGAGGQILRIRRELFLDEGWQDRLAPTGLGILIHGAICGDYEVMAGEGRVGSWSCALPGISKSRPRLFAVPSEAVAASGRLRLEIRLRWRDLAPDRARRQQLAFGEDWWLGDLQRLRTEAERHRLEGFNSDFPLLILVLLYVAVGVYHLQLFRRDRRCREYLWFGLTVLVVAGHSILYTHWVSGSSVHPAMIRRLYDLTGLVMVALTIQFLWTFFGRPISRPIRTYQFCLLGLAGLFALVPGAGWMPPVEAFAKIATLPFLVGVAAVLVSEVRRGNTEARTLSIGGFAIVAAGLVEMTSQLLGMGSTFPLQAVAFTLFALSMAFSLSDRFSRVHRDLDALRLQLEEMVEDRAAELSTANQRLQSEIGERELAQEAMRLLERAVEQSIDGILVADLDGATLFINEAWARMHGHETFEAFRSHIDFFYTREQMDSEVRPALDQVRQEGSWEGEIAHLRKDGSTFPTWMSIALLRDPVNEPVGFVVVARDITERLQGIEEKQRIEAKIQEAEKLRSLAELAGGIAHDYNNLLTGVLVNSSLARRELPEGSVAGEKLIQVGTAAERAVDLTTQLLAYAGAGSLATERVDLSELVAGFRAELTRGAGDGARLEIELAEGLPRVEIDSSQVRQAVLNLICNAADAIKEAGGGDVKLETGVVEADSAYLAGTYPDEDHLPGEYVFLRVSDTGNGIDQRSRGRIFDPFFSTRPSARGLGLATVLSAVRAHRGTIKVSGRPGEGATFELLLPAAAELPEEMPSGEKAPGGWQGSGTVLVVDDEHIMRDVSESILEQIGFEVLATGEGRRALELYRRHGDDIRLVLLDRTMPTMSGEEVLAGILALDPRARVVLMSGYTRDATVRDLIARGLADFLPKPFRPQELVDKVRSVLEPG